ncbi:hypothetical protein GTU99_19685 [Streptomyces sp. PRKS01-65]|nr:hypothetical protein [Streptomyces harenosi]NEY34400.1 hypothetical protein [Streptomyces harenosi]
MAVPLLVGATVLAGVTVAAAWIGRAFWKACREWARTSTAEGAGGPP